MSDVRDWWPPDYEVGDMTFWEMPERIRSLTRIGDRLFVNLDDGRTVDMTDAFPKEGATKQ